MPKLLLWILAAFSALAFVISLIFSTTQPRLLSIEEAGGIEYVYQLDTRALLPTANLEDFANRVIEVLKRRAQSGHQTRITWRVVNHKDIQIQIPFARPATPASREALQNAQTAEEAALAALKAVSWDQPALRALLQFNPMERDAALARLAPRGSDQEKSLRDLAAAHDALQKATADLLAFKPGGATDEATLLAARAQRQRQFDALFDEAPGQSINTPILQRVMTEADHNPDAADEIDRILTQPWPQKKQIEAYVKAHRQVLALTDPGEIDARDLARMITRAGILDFRIAVLPNEISNDQYAEAAHVLRQKGVEQQIDLGVARARWFLIHRSGRAMLTGGGYVTAQLPEDVEAYILLYDDHDRTLTHSDPKRQRWSTGAKSPMSNAGEIQLPFFLDPVGAGYMGQLTTDWVRHPMAILLDDKVMSAPNINGRITDAGIITFGSSRSPAAHLKEAEQLKAIMDAGSLPVLLNPNPLSSREILPVPGYRSFPWRLLFVLASAVAFISFLMLAFRKPRLTTPA